MAGARGACVLAVQREKQEKVKLVVVETENNLQNAVNVPTRRVP